MAATAKIVSAGMDNKGTADDALGADQLDELVLLGSTGVALSVGVKVAKVTDVAVLILGGTVLLVVGVDYIGEQQCQPRFDQSSRHYTL